MVVSEQRSGQGADQQDDGKQETQNQNGVTAAQPNDDQISLRG